ncbi:DEAD/DEAH box helicase [Gracilibacillus thailandensis]|uniref:Helicase SNF n=1 Tax=Gracilibacillus thailandensis TaxID=563735 RepID=A0A6N7R096_9BACI|nr:DEAD/DEAH box helicase [Gracilibacillus thailandensis]MRI66902.1 helicase SNF [Gracilibacillus thailandensis]
MNIKWSHKKIEEASGKISFKKGLSFYRSNKVYLKIFTAHRCEAIVAGKEDFHVTVEQDESGRINTRCSCPTLASVKNDCQHVAAVLLAISEHSPRESRSSSSSEISEGLMTLLENRRVRPSAQQPRFESRQVLPLAFTCKLITNNQGQFLFGIEIEVGTTKVTNIRAFLKQVKEHGNYQLTSSFTYNPELHCFSTDTDDIIQQLIQVMNDETAYGYDRLIDKFEYNIDQLLVIPPSPWQRLVPLLTKAPVVKLANGEKRVDKLYFSDHITLPLSISITKTDNHDSLLTVKGRDKLVMLDAYQALLFDDHFIQIKEKEFHYLSELIQILDTSKTNQIRIPPKQTEFFIEKGLPILKRLGQVHLHGAVTNQLKQNPLITKLYLDRVRNRLLAGVEFHYGNILINPLDDEQIETASILIRDEEKENAILQMMDDSQFAKTDSGYFLHNEALEYDFLYHMLPKVQKIAQVFATTAVRNRIFKENPRPKIKVKIQKERTNWLEFKFEMDGIPDQEIRDILSALEEKQKYYRLRDGSLLSLETKEFEELQRFLRSAAPIQDKDDLVSGLHVPVIKGIQLLDSADDQVFIFEQSFRQFLHNIENPDNQSITLPNSLEPILRDYQTYGYKWLKTLANHGFGGILADDMGLGKTLQSIAFILSELPTIRKKKLPTLIVCPSSLVYNWQSEIRKFAPDIQVAIVDGNRTKRANRQTSALEMDVVITSYQLLRMDIDWYKKQAFHTVFFDEAQAFKNPVTQTAQAVKKIQADNRFALTGTPVENNQEELWSIFHVVFPELFQGLKEYSNLTRTQIARRSRPFLLRRVKEDVLSELPEKIESRESVELLPDQKKLYATYLAKLRHDTLKHLDKDTLRKNRIKILAGLTRLRQICCHPALFVDGYKGSSAKFEQLKQILEESRLARRRVLIFSQFTKMLELIGRDLAIQGKSFLYLDGQTPSEERVERCNQFNAGECDLFLISMKAGGTGLNLTGADTVILYDTWWNPAVEEQAADRAHRIGQTSAVQVIKLVARGTIEEKMNDLQEQKRSLIEEIIDSKEKASSTLTEEDIREILSL